MPEHHGENHGEEDPSVARHHREHDQVARREIQTVQDRADRSLPDAWDAAMRRVGAGGHGEEEFSNCNTREWGTYLKGFGTMGAEESPGCSS